MLPASVAMLVVRCVVPSPSAQALQEGCADVHVLVDLPIETILRGADATEEGPANAPQDNSDQGAQDQSASQRDTDSVVGTHNLHR